MPMAGLDQKADRADSPEPREDSLPAVEKRRSSGFFGNEARSDSSASPVALTGFLHPRYLRSWCLIAWLRLCAMLPWSLSLALHKRLGGWLGARSRRANRLVMDNLARCFPDRTEAERRALADEFFRNMGAIVAELAAAWYRPQHALEPLFHVEGKEHLEQALGGGRGVILLAGHFTPIEICSVGVRPHVPLYALMHNNRRSRLLSEIQRRRRDRMADHVFDKRNLRALLRCLNDNAAVWFSGDEAHTGKSSALLPFFGEPALTSTALSRLARLSGAAVVPVFYCRHDDDSGYTIRFEPALDGFPSGDEIADTKRLIDVLERHIRECPAQYFWKQRRFRRASGHRPGT